MSAPSSPVPVPASSAARVAPNQWHALGGVWRLTFRRFLAPGQLLALAGMLAVLGVISYATTRQGNANNFFDWTAGFYLTFLVPVMAFLSGSGAIRDEMKSGSVDYVLTRPVRRPAFVVFKYLSHVACIQIVYFLPLGLLVGLGVYREIPAVTAALPLLLTAQVLAVAAFTALGFLSGVLTARYLVIGLLYAGVIEIGLGVIPTQLNRLSMSRQLHAMLAHLTSGNDTLLIAGQSAFTTAAILLTFSAVIVSLAALSFSRQELAAARSA